MVGYIFPGQGAQFEGMAKGLLEQGEKANELLLKANDILGFDIKSIMLEGSAEDLKQTRVTQPAIFLHSVIKAELAGDEFNPDFVAGHSLGEFSALTSAGSLSFQEGLQLVSKRAEAMQKACEIQESTMAAILGLEDAQVEAICASVDGMVVPANYNCPGQLVISGSKPAIEAAVTLSKEAGARRALVLNVGGAFHSPLMEPAKDALAEAIVKADIQKPSVPIFQNVNGIPQTDPVIIKENLIQQLTAPVMWTKTMINMREAGVEKFIEVGGTGKVLLGLVKKLDRKIPCETI